MSIQNDAIASVPVLLQHQETGARFLLIGTGYGLAANSRPRFGVFRNVDKAQHKMVCVCDTNGEIDWLPSRSVRIISIAGVAPSSVKGLSAFADLHPMVTSITAPRPSDEHMICAQCSRPLVDRICSHCDHD